MILRILVLVLITEILAQSTTNKVYETTTIFSLNPGTRNSFKDCTTKKGEPGRCVHYSYCDDRTYEIEVGGNISEQELRTFECNKQVEWCCSDKIVTVVPKPTKVEQEVNCSVTEKPVCPWCAKLFRNGNDERKRYTGFFCMGTMIGSRVVLTTGTCMLQAQNNDVWARVQDSADANIRYPVKFRQIHPDYNSGTRANDLAFFVLEKNVDWGKDDPKGACLGLQFPLLGDCMGAGIDFDENIYMAPFYVEPGNCGRGSKLDASCGELQGEYCSVVPGSPIICRLNEGPFVVVGMAKQKCFGTPPKVLLGNFSMAMDWIETSLQETYGLQEKNYLHKLILDF